MTKPRSDLTRKDCLKKLHIKRGRNIITYYSGFWQKPQTEHTDIRDLDVDAFYHVIQGLDPKKGLDLILHTPGGSVEAAERIGNYLRDVFRSDIEVFVPMIAMSAGTMIACISRKIHMGKQSSLGPTDPQFDGISAGFVLAEFEMAAKQIKKDITAALAWNPIITQYSPSFIMQCIMAIDLSKEIVSNWLKSGMLSDKTPKYNDNQMADRIADYLNAYKDRKSHGRQISASEAQSIGLTIARLEDDKELESLVLSIHEHFMIAFMNSDVLKAVENHNGVSRIFSVKSK